jgi:hypothetical protein
MYLATSFEFWAGLRPNTAGALISVAMARSRARRYAKHNTVRSTRLLGVRIKDAHAELQISRQ